MSYNIDSVIFVRGKLSIPREKFFELAVEYQDSAPECSIFDRQDFEILVPKKSKSKPQIIPSDEFPSIITYEPDTVNPRGNAGPPYWSKLRWRGEGSGSYYDTFKDILSQMDGEAELVLIWEGGDSIGGLRIRNGEVTEHEVLFSLKE